MIVFWGDKSLIPKDLPSPQTKQHLSRVSIYIRELSRVFAANSVGTLMAYAFDGFCFRDITLYHGRGHAIGLGSYLDIAVTVIYQVALERL